MKVFNTAILSTAVLLSVLLLGVSSTVHAGGLGSGSFDESGAYQYDTFSGRSGAPTGDSNAQLFQYFQREHENAARRSQDDQRNAHTPPEYNVPPPAFVQQDHGNFAAPVQGPSGKVTMCYPASKYDPYVRCY